MKLLPFVLAAAAALPVSLSAQNSEIECGTPYTVSPGDTLSKISIKAYGVSAFQVLQEANMEALGENPNLLFVGQKIQIPCRTATPAQQIADAEPVIEPVESQPAGPVTLTFNRSSDPRFVINVGIIDPYLQLIETATEGRVTFVDPPEPYTDQSAQFDLVTSGQVDATYVYNGYLADSHPLLQLPMIPLMGGSAEQTAVSLWNLHEKYLSASNYFSDAQLLGFISAPAAHIWRDLDTPVRAGEDILQKNAYPVPYFDGLDTIGPKQVQARNKEKYASGVDANGDALTFMMAHGAARGGAILNPERGVTEVENGIYTPTFSVIMSNDAWARISQEDQETIKLVSGMVLAKRSAAWDDFDNGHRKIILDAGLNVQYPDRNLHLELENAAQKQLRTWAAHASELGIDADVAIATYRANLASLRHLIIYR